MSLFGYSWSSPYKWELDINEWYSALWNYFETDSIIVDLTDPIYYAYYDWLVWDVISDTYTTCYYCDSNPYSSLSYIYSLLNYPSTSYWKYNSSDLGIRTKNSLEQLKSEVARIMASVPSTGTTSDNTFASVQSQMAKIIVESTDAFYAAFLAAVKDNICTGAHRDFECLMKNLNKLHGVLASSDKMVQALALAFRQKHGFNATGVDEKANEQIGRLKKMVNDSIGRYKDVAIANPKKSLDGEQLEGGGKKKRSKKHHSKSKRKSRR